jgi:hypothetical protein
MPSFSQNAVNEYLALRVSYTGRRLFGGMTTCQGDNNEHTSTMNTLRLILAASGLALLLPSVSFADVADGLDEMSPEERREYVQSLSEEDRQQLREQKRAEWQAMSDEERRAARDRYQRNRDKNRAAMRQNWENMSEEERAAARQQYKEREAQRREIWNNMSDEEKAVARERMQEQRGMNKGKRGKDKQGRGDPQRGQQ